MVALGVVVMSGVVVMPGVVVAAAVLVVSGSLDYLKKFKIQILLRLELWKPENSNRLWCWWCRWWR